MGFFKKKTNEEKNNFDDFPPIGGLIVSKMIVDENIKPRFMYREKRAFPEDSGWRVFTGFESDEYADNPDNIKIYNPSTILKIDASIENILLKGIGSVYEKSDKNDWQKVTDFELEDDFIVTHQLTDNWKIEINNLFEKTTEQDGSLYYTTGDKSLRLLIWNDYDKNKLEIYKEQKNRFDSRDEKIAKTLQTFDFSDEEVLRIGYLIEERDESKIYKVLHGVSIIDNQFIQLALYFDEEQDLNWAVEIWKNIKTS